MIKFENHIGEIHLSNKYLISLIGNAATNCFGVVGMNTFGPKQRISSLFKKSESLENGVIIHKNDDNELIIDLHITVSYGLNVSTVVESIMEKVQYTLETESTVKVAKINVFVDEMQS